MRSIVKYLLSVQIPMYIIMCTRIYKILGAIKFSHLIETWLN